MHACCDHAVVVDGECAYWTRQPRSERMPAAAVPACDGSCGLAAASLEIPADQETLRSVDQGVDRAVAAARPRRPLRAVPSCKPRDGAIVDRREGAADHQCVVHDEQFGDDIDGQAPDGLPATAGPARDTRLVGLELAEVADRVDLSSVAGQRVHQGRLGGAYEHPGAAVPALDAGRSSRPKCPVRDQQGEGLSRGAPGAERCPCRAVPAGYAGCLQRPGAAEPAAHTGPRAAAIVELHDRLDRTARVVIARMAGVPVDDRCCASAATRGEGAEAGQPARDGTIGMAGKTAPHGFDASERSPAINVT